MMKRTIKYQEFGIQTNFSESSKFTFVSVKPLNLIHELIARLDKKSINHVRFHCGNIVCNTIHTCGQCMKVLDSIAYEITKSYEFHKDELLAVLGAFIWLSVESNGFEVDVMDLKL